MKTKLIPTAFAVLALTSVAAFAASTLTDGVIKALDPVHQTVTLANGVAYILPKGFDIKTLTVGEKVAVAWTESGGKYMVETIKPAA